MIYLGWTAATPPSRRVVEVEEGRVMRVMIDYSEHSSMREIITMVRLSLSLSLSLS